MNKVYLRKNIIRELAKRSGYSQIVCEDILNAYHDFLADVVYERDIMQDYGFITLSVKDVPARIRSDPRNNNIKFNLEPSHKIVIKAGKSLKDILDIIDKE